MPTNRDNMRLTFERAEVVGQWLNEIENNVEGIKHSTSKLNDLSTNQTGKSYFCKARLEKYDTVEFTFYSLYIFAEKNAGVCLKNKFVVTIWLSMKID